MLADKLRCFADECRTFADEFISLADERRAFADGFCVTADEFTGFADELTGFADGFCGFADAKRLTPEIIRYEKSKLFKGEKRKMNDRERNIYDMLISTTEFDDANKADYSHLPDAAAHFTIVRDVIAKLAEYFSEQASGAVTQAVEQKSVTRAAIRRRMKRFAATARGLNIDDPGLRRLFRVPDENSDQTLLAAAREFVEEATRFAAQFAARGITTAETEALADDIASLDAAIRAKASANTEGVGATAGVDAEIERGMDSEIVLDSIMKNVYYDDPVRLAEWKSARHVRSAKRTKPGTGGSPAPPPQV